MGQPAEFARYPLTAMSGNDEWLSGYEQIEVDADTAVLVEGERHTQLLVLVDGMVRVSIGPTDVAVVSDRGTFLGEMAFLLDVPATATVTTVQASTFRRIPDPAAAIRENPSLALAIATGLANRLNLVTGYLADLQTQYADRSDHLGVVADILQSLTQNRRTVIEPGSERELEAPY
jgi:CRP-like cAMP-binding protein